MSDRVWKHRGTTVHACMMAGGQRVRVSLNPHYPNAGSEFLSVPLGATDEAVTKAVRDFLRNRGLEKLRAAEKRWQELYAASLRLNEEVAAAERAERDRMRLKGYRQRLEAWVHPAQGGDDYPVVEYALAFTPEYVKSMLRREGSSVLSDYRIENL